MYNRFRKHGYPSNVLEPALVRASSLDRHSLLQRKPVTSKKDRVFFATCYRTEAYNIRKIIRKNWDLLQCDETLSDLFSGSLVFSFRRATIGDRLVQSNLPAKEQTTWFIKCLMVPLNVDIAEYVTL